MSDTGKIEVSGATLLGGRPNNEDSYIALAGDDAPRALDAVIAVSDGMGGAAKGEVASAMMIEKLRSHSGDASGDIESWLKSVVEEANREVFEEGDSSDEKKGMGATFNGGVLKDGILYIANVGDSRTFLMRNGSVERITKDHSVAEEMGLSDEKAKGRSIRNIITRAVGSFPEVEVDTYKIPLKEGDTIATVTDGVWEPLGREGVESVLSDGSSPEITAERLVRAAVASAGERADNATAVVLSYKGDGGRKSKGRPSLWRRLLAYIGLGG